jgi:hypothetical protein
MGRRRRLLAHQDPTWRHRHRRLRRHPSPRHRDLEQVRCPTAHFDFRWKRRSQLALAGPGRPARLRRPAYAYRTLGRDLRLYGQACRRHRQWRKCGPGRSHPAQGCASSYRHSMRHISTSRTAAKQLDVYQRTPSWIAPHAWSQGKVKYVGAHLVNGSAHRLPAASTIPKRRWIASPPTPRHSLPSAERSS